MTYNEPCIFFVGLWLCFDDLVFLALPAFLDRAVFFYFGGQASPSDSSLSCLLWLEVGTGDGSCAFRFPPFFFPFAILALPFLELSGVVCAVFVASCTCFSSSSFHCFSSSCLHPASSCLCLSSSCLCLSSSCLRHSSSCHSSSLLPSSCLCSSSSLYLSSSCRFCSSSCLFFSTLLCLLISSSSFLFLASSPPLSPPAPGSTSST